MNQRITIDILGVTPEFMEYISSQIRNLEIYAETWGGQVITTSVPLEAHDEQTEDD